MNPRVFISYRRRDSVLYADLLKEYLDERLGLDNVFFDTDSIVFGVDFIRAIENAIVQCTCLIAVIGPDWASGVEKPTDYVRLEIETALNHGVAILPVFIAEVHSVPEGLPPEIAAIRAVNGIRLRSRRQERMEDLAAVHSSVMRLEGERVRRAASRESVTSFNKNSLADADDLFHRGLRLVRSQQLEEGIVLLGLASQNGSVRACKVLINIYGGDVVKAQDLKEVLKWTLRAAELGDRESKTMAGMYFAYGIGTEQDFEAAERWLRASAGENDSLASKLLAEIRSQLGRWNMKVMAKTKTMEYGLKQDLRSSWVDLNSSWLGS